MSDYAERYAQKHKPAGMTTQDVYKFYHPNQYIANAPLSSPEIQNFLPSVFRGPGVEGDLQSWYKNFSELLRNPGGLSSNVSDAIRPQLAQESQSIAQNFRGIQSNQAGAAARGNMPTSIKGALQSALDVAQERAQRGARSDALSQSDTLRRQDLGGGFNLLNQMLQYIQSGRGQAINAAQINQGQQQIDQQKKASNEALMASLLIAFASSSKLKEGFNEVPEDKILSAVRSMPVYEWSYKGDRTRHLGPMAEDFHSALGLGDGERIPVVDAVGMLVASTQALAKKIDRLEKKGNRS